MKISKKLIDSMKIFRYGDFQKMSREETIAKIYEDDDKEKQDDSIIRKKVEEIKNMCFVLMPFKERFNEIYKQAIKPTVEEKFTCLRADEIFSANVVIQDIQQYIQQAKFLIADLTGRNPNVFYELGLAHAIPKEVILITQNGKDIPFDLRHIRYIIYEDSIAGSTKLKDALRTTMQNLKCNSKNK